MTEVYKLPDVNGARVGDYVIVDVLNEPDCWKIKCATALTVDTKGWCFSHMYTDVQKGCGLTMHIQLR